MSGMPSSVCFSVSLRMMRSPLTVSPKQVVVKVVVEVVLYRVCGSRGVTIRLGVGPCCGVSSSVTVG